MDLLRPTRMSMRWIGASCAAGGSRSPSASGDPRHVPGTEHLEWGPERYIVGAVVVMLAQAALIAGLLVQRRARQRAEIESRGRSGARRRCQPPPQTMSALTNSITHELGQPLSSIIHNAPGAADDGHGQSGHLRNDRRDCPTSRPRASRRPTSSIATDHVAKSSGGHELIDLHAIMDGRVPCPRRPRDKDTANRGNRFSLYADP